MRLAGQEVTEVHEVGAETGEQGQGPTKACQCAGAGCVNVRGAHQGDHSSVLGAGQEVAAVHEVGAGTGGTGARTGVLGMAVSVSELCFQRCPPVWGVGQRPGGDPSGCGEGNTARYVAIPACNRPRN